MLRIAEQRMSLAADLQRQPNKISQIEQRAGFTGNAWHVDCLAVAVNEDCDPPNRSVSHAETRECEAVWSLPGAVVLTIPERRAQLQRPLTDAVPEGGLHRFCRQQP